MKTKNILIPFLILVMTIISIAFLFPVSPPEEGYQIKTFSSFEEMKTFIKENSADLGGLVPLYATTSNNGRLLGVLKKTRKKHFQNIPLQTSR